MTAHITVIVGSFIRDRRLGIVAGVDGPMRLKPGLIRIPDVSFVSWVRLGNCRPPPEAVASFGPELAIEVLSRGNTAKEMADKLADYFAAGARLVWYVDPATGTVAVHDAPGRPTILRGDDLLPGFETTVAALLALPEPPPGPDAAG